MDATLSFPPEVIEVIAVRVAEILTEMDQARAERASEEALLTPDEAAVLLRCKRQRIYDLISQRRLPAMREGGRRLIRRADLLRLVESA